MFFKSYFEVDDDMLGKNESISEECDSFVLEKSFGTGDRLAKKSSYVES